MDTTEKATENGKTGNGKAAPSKAPETPIVKAPPTAADILAACRMEAVLLGIEPFQGPHGTFPTYAWQLTLTYDGRTFTTPYCMGLGYATHTPEPGDLPVANPPQEALDVLAREGKATGTGTLYARPPRLHWVLTHLQDAATVPKSFAKWCKATGANPDSRSAERIHEGCKARKKSLTVLFGTAFDAFTAADFERGVAK